MIQPDIRQETSISACRIICKTFKHSPVFRAGGDEFSVISRGDDLEHIDDLMGIVAGHDQEAFCAGDIVTACGMAEYENVKGSCVASAFERADQAKYENRNDLKSMESWACRNNGCERMTEDGKGKMKTTKNLHTGWRLFAGRGRRIRTLNKGFGDPRVTITPCP